jgi:hypothetical protein
MKPQRVAMRWKRFIQEKESTDLWTEDNFLLFLENEEAILNYSIDFDGDKVRLFKDGNPKLKEVYKQKLDRLREIYNERFNKTEPEPEDHTKFSDRQIFYLLEKIGLFETEFYRNIKTEKDKHSLIAKILNCHIDNARKLKNGTVTATDENKKIVTNFISRIQKK